MLTPYSFQIEYKPAGCEDAPPVASVDYSIVCDGLGGSGLTKIELPSDDGQQTVSRTSAYIGSRVVCDCVTEYFEANPFTLDFHFQKNKQEADIKDYTEGLKKEILQALDRKKEELGVEAPRAKSLKLFPTTLASAMYFKNDDALYTLCIWAGDSRIYCLSPSKGLQLLSQDDSAESEDSMNSGTVMSNCIAVDNEFRLNYLIHKITEPSVVFACSDGCFDYLPSPLNLEWVILNLILNLNPDTPAQQTGEVFANALRSDIFEQIAADDTTMSGILYQIESVKEMQSLYQKRMDDFGSLAVSMNRTINQMKDLRTERDKLRRIKNSRAEEISAKILDEIKEAMKSEEANRLSDWIRNLELYKPYKEKEDKAHEYYVQLAEKEAARKPGQEKYQEFLTMIKLDYMRYMTEHNDQSRNASRDAFFSNNMQAMPWIETLQNLLATDEFYDYLEEQGHPTETLRKYGNEIVSVLGESLPAMDVNMRDMWSHAYYSRNRFSKKLADLDRDPEFRQFANSSLRNPQIKKAISGSTWRKYDEYKAEASQKKPAAVMTTAEEKNELRAIRKEFIDAHAEEVIDEIRKLSVDEQKNILLLKGISEEQLSRYQTFDSDLKKIEADIEQAEKKSDEIWAQYRVDYERFKTGEMRGSI